MKAKFLIFFLIGLNSIIFIHLLLSQSNLALLNPAGIIAQKERDLLVISTLLGLSVIIPVVCIAFFVAYKYRSTNKNATYMPDWKPPVWLQYFCWLFITGIMVIMAVIMLQSNHELDPAHPLKSDTKPLKIQVVALQWKWLFIYPEQNIATVNYIAFPEKTPIIFELTADAPMNSFWIPQLGGQIYAMEGMVTKTHLMADRIGEFQGSSAEISGRGFTGMRFIAKSTSQKDFDQWVQQTKDSAKPLTLTAYTLLAKPSENTKPTVYAPVEQGLYNGIVMKFMAPPSPSIPENMNHEMMEESMPGMQH